MVIAGPNGTGKSTLLNAIRSGSGWHDILYIGPHRAMRRQNVQQRHLISTPFVLQELLTRNDSPGFEGIALVSGARDPWGHDDSANYLKHVLCQIEIDFQRAITERYHRDGEIRKGSLPDPWKPLRELCANLLPHIRFSGIDSKNRDHIQCLWTVHGAQQGVDLDDLSSGEKSIVQMFFPLVETAIRNLLAEVSGEAALSRQAEQCILIDEPELHLHPNLQVKVLDYLRVLTTGSKMQVILATHSPTIVESASFEELYLLRPVELVAAGDNQLVQVATDDDRLRLLRDLFGGTSNLTSMQPVVVVEGIREEDARRVATDRKLYRALHPGFDQITLVPGGGKSQCLALARGLREVLKAFSKELKAVALVDRDYAPASSEGAEGTEDADIFLLPVAMIENFLIDPDGIWQAIQSVVDKTGLSSSGDVAAALSSILDALEPEEVERRAGAKLGTATFRASRPIDNVPGKAGEFCTDLLARFSAEAVRAAVVAATEEVDKLKSAPRRREEFHGKSILQGFFGKHLHATPMSKVVFAFEAARHSRNRKAVKVFFDSFFRKVNPGWELP